MPHLWMRDADPPPPLLSPIKCIIVEVNSYTYHVLINKAENIIVLQCSSTDKVLFRPLSLLPSVVRPATQGALKITLD
jgi:hypothetical protein